VSPVIATIFTRNGLGRVAAILLFGLGALGFFLHSHYPVIRLGTGDEPHYLVVADALANHGGPELTEAYSSGQVARTVLPATDLDFTPEGLRQVSGAFGPFHSFGAKHGIFSVHSLGLPLLLSPVVKLGGGMLHAKAMMLVVSLIVPLYGWRVAGVFFSSSPQRLAAGLSLSLVTLFMIAASQIYPDLLGGVILGNGALTVAGWRDGLIKRWALPGQLLVLLPLAALPWLHLRLAVPAFLCVAAYLALVRPRLRDAAVWALVLGASSLSVACYNHYAFGHWGGPYGERDVEVSATSAMVLLGLQVDQLQGIFIHAPILLCALFGVGVLTRRDWRLALFLVLLYGALVVPNSIHPNWYGGGSYAGRFVLAGGLVLLVPAGYGLSCLFSLRPGLGFLACGLHLLAEFQLWYRYALAGQDPYTPPFVRMLGDYPSPWAPFQHWLPALYRLDVAERHWPNLAWLAALALLFAAGLAWRREGRWGDRMLVLAGVCVVAGGIAGAVETPVLAGELPPARGNADFDFSQPEAEGLLGQGWSIRESWGVWSVGGRSDLKIPVAASSADLELAIDAMAFLPRGGMTVTVPVRLDGTPVASWIFDGAANRAVRTVRIPASFAAHGGVLTVSFTPQGTVPPYEVPGLGETRHLGIAIRRATLRTLEN
jgi:hypothetical protein